MGVMDEKSSRIFIGVCLLVLLWIGTYWVYEPGRPASGADVIFDPADDQGPLVTLTDSSGPSIGQDGDPNDGGSAAGDTEESQLPVSPSEDTAAVAKEDKASLPLPKPEPGTKVIPPEFRDYSVRSGDTLETIARDQLGSSSLWTAIAKANPLKDPRRLRVGEIIRVPLDADNIQGKVVAADGGTSGDGPAEDGNPQATWVEYTVRSGDSLTRIARSYYGSIRFADAIYEANRDRLDSPDAISVGQVLRLPPLGDAEE
ncbi:MAG: LysM peptidoglycan-binding domain-containing protein [Phycisphaerales bacterium]